METTQIRQRGERTYRIVGSSPYQLSVYSNRVERTLGEFKSLGEIQTQIDQDATLAELGHKGRSWSGR